MGSTENAPSRVWGFHDTFERWHGTDKPEVRAYFSEQRRWVMEAMPNMPEDQWLEYTKWVKSVTDPLPRKSRKPEKP